LSDTTFSIQCKGNYFSKKEEPDLDVELPIGCNGQTYLMTLNHWLNQIQKLDCNFDLSFSQAGVNVLQDDWLVHMSLPQKGVKQRNKLVFKFSPNLNILLVICMGGGYLKDVDDWTPIIQAHTNVYC
jgi:acetoin utilization deacetylase AcuC-like enzyme